MEPETGHERSDMMSTLVSTENKTRNISDGNYRLLNVNSNEATGAEVKTPPGQNEDSLIYSTRQRKRDAQLEASLS